jgi:hypothetical protein
MLSESIKDSCSASKVRGTPLPWLPTIRKNLNAGLALPQRWTLPIFKPEG